MSGLERHVGPFRARWIDGHEEHVQDGSVWGDEGLELAWREQRARGAVVLIDGRNVVRDHNYREATLPAVGARVRHKRHPELTGVVQGYEYQTGGRTPSGATLSAIPLRVYWDGEAKQLGPFGIYQCVESLDVLDAREVAR